MLGAFDKRDDVAHAKDTVGHTVGVEDVDGVDTLARAHKLDGLGDDGAYRQGSTAAGVSVELGEDDAVKVEAVVEGLGRVYGVLAGH